MGAAGSRVRRWYSSQPEMVRRLMLLQIVAWLLMVVLRLYESGLHDQVVGMVALVPGESLLSRGWTLLTYPLVHSATDMFGALIDVALLSILGGTFGHRWRSSHFLFFWFFTAVGGGVLHWAAGSYLDPKVFGVPALGSQASNMALLVAFWLVFGERYYRLWGLEKPVKAKWVVGGVFAIQVLFFVAGANHFLALQVGGALLGWLLVTGRWRPGKFGVWLRRLGLKVRGLRRGIRSV